MLLINIFPNIWIISSQISESVQPFKMIQLTLRKEISSLFPGKSCGTQTQRVMKYGDSWCYSRWFVFLTLGFKRFKLPSKRMRATLVVSLVMNSTQQINLETFLHHEFHRLLAKFWITPDYCRQPCCLNRMWYNLIQNHTKEGKHKWNMYRSFETFWATQK